jgi:hypothetical protein
LTFRVNVTVPYQLTKLVLPAMIERSRTAQRRRGPRGRACVGPRE